MESVPTWLIFGIPLYWVLIAGAVIWLIVVLGGRPK